ncbi:P22 phage major capsid protein family protein [Curtobacterium sp. MCSS17_007]|uniref:P22 phage major capsid protein family protein n=1 Tax=Curtobacterium sp. MCSS17_007 TaxID=2175646 RepID=UPI000DA821BF|nr:P22 phage major capsid protein family protein [Curtobacterium sp. MCSS17_007]WIE76548.1 P22 phage major capsid protein family protein [Curtobacterium sp. MCSS17_007]
MANSFNPNYDARQIAEVAMALYRDNARLASLVAVYDESKFQTGNGNTVYLTVPGALTAHSRGLDDVTNAIVLDAINETREPITLDVHAYSAVALSEADLSLEIGDFSAQVLAPQVDAVSDKIETAVANVIAGIDPEDGVSFNASNPVTLFTKGRSILRARGVDVAAEDLVAIVGSNVADALLDSGMLDYQATGTEDSLRTGALGTIRGFQTVESGRVDDDEVVFMTASGIALAVRAPEVPAGAPFGALVQDPNTGMSLRYLRDYDVNTTRDRSLVSTFVGAQVAPLYRVDRTQDTGKQGDNGFTAGTAAVTRVAGGAVAKVSIAA